MKKILNFNKQQKGKGRPSDLACIAKVSVRKIFDRKRIKVLTPKQMLQRLSKALVQIKAGNTSENLLNEMRQIIYSLHRDKEVTKKYRTRQ